jgi:phage tail sheath protein FI
MPFQLSPGVNVTEIDLTTVVPTVASTDGAIAGIFNWGPVGERVLIDSETKLVNIFGKPNSNNAETFFTAANFLSYGNRLYVVRAANTSNTTSANVGALNAIANTDTITTHDVVKNSNDFAKHGSFDVKTLFVAKYPGQLGNSLRVSVCDSAKIYSSDLPVYGVNEPGNFDVTVQLTTSIGSPIASISCNGAGSALDSESYLTRFMANLSIGDVITLGNSSIGTQFSKIVGYANTANTLQISANSAAVQVANADGAYIDIVFDSPYRLSTSFVTSNGGVANGSSNNNNYITRSWEFFNVIDHAPTQTDYVAQFGNTTAQDAIHVVVADENGAFTGVPGTVLETYQDLSRATDAKTVGGATNYYRTVINQGSQYVWSVNDRSGANSAVSTNVANSSNEKALTLDFNAGTDGFTEANAPLSVIADGYDMFASAEDVDISLILQGKPIGGTTSSGGMTVSNFQLANYLIDNIAENRKDCVVFLSPDDNVVTNHSGNEATAIVNWRNAVHDSSYAVMDSGYKYMYDRYNDVYRYIPTNGDIAGLCVRTDNTRDPWWSPAGFNRGQIKNLVKLRYNPKKADRDILYKNGINPVITFPGQGTILYGDKTLQTKPSAFDHINVRRLFIVLEKAIAIASKFFLFEFNDEFTRAQFKNLVIPYLRDIQGRRGITDFLVVCDATNNTAERIDRNEFWGDIYIKPARSINFIQLNFVAVRSGVQFSEIVGQF